jgi:hypothetical protein
MISDQNSRVLRRLKSLNNVETFNRCLSAARSGTLNKNIYQVLYDRRRDYRYYLIVLLQLSPAWAKPILGKAMQRVLTSAPV